jgi:MFS family permease
MVGGSLFLALAHTTVVGLFVGGVISIAAAWALATLMFIWVADGVPQRDHATLFGLLIAVWSISMIIGSLTAGRLVEIAPASPFVVVGVINAVALLVGWRYYAGMQNNTPIRPEPPAPQTP